jgi:hypothetical protein
MKIGEVSEVGAKSQQNVALISQFQEIEFWVSPSFSMAGLLGRPAPLPFRTGHLFVAPVQPLSYIRNNVGPTTDPARSLLQ